MRVQLLQPREWIDRFRTGRLMVTPTLPGYDTLPKTWSYEGRRLAFHIVYAVVRGSIDLHHNGRWTRMESGSAFWLMPDELHTLRLTSKTEPTSVYHMRLTAVDRQNRLCRLDTPLIKLSAEPEIMRDVADLVHEIYLAEPFAEERVFSRLMLLFTAMLRDTTANEAAPGLSDRQTKVLHAYVAEHHGERPTPTDLADAVNLSGEYFARLFKRTFHLSPRTWLMHERIRIASAALADTRTPIGRIAQRFGYDDQYLFSRQFRKVIGCSPREFRRAYLVRR